MVKYTNWWDVSQSSVNVQDTWFTAFFDRCCSDWEGADSNRVNMITVFGHPQSLLSLDKEDANFYFTGENTTNMHTQWGNEFVISQYVDATLSFFTGNPKSIRFPLWLTYWRFDTDGLFQPKVIPEKQCKAILVAHHTANGLRLHAVDAVKATGIEIDSSNANVFPGTQQVQVGEGSTGKIEAIQNYVYNICCENSMTNGYTTEKPMESLAAGCIALYWGNDPVEQKVLYQDNICYVHKLPQDLSVRRFNYDRVWREDALVYIYATYLKMWGIAWKKMDCKKLCSDVQTVSYDVTSIDDACETLKKHWCQYKHFHTPRPIFKLGTSVLVAEHLSNVMYQKYNLA